jgi:hypothetical protein
LFQRKRKRLPVDFTAAPIAIVGNPFYERKSPWLRNSQFFILFSELLVAQTREPNASTAIGNGQARLGDNAVNDLFSAIVVQRVQGVAPAREFATKELGLVPCGVFLVPGMEGLQKKFALRYQPIDGFCILH